MQTVETKMFATNPVRRLVPIALFATLDSLYAHFEREAASAKT